MGYCVLRTATRVWCHTILPDSSHQQNVKSNQTMIYPEWSGPGDSHCDNINHWPAGTRRSVQDRPISSGINIPDNNGDVTPQVATARHMTRDNISNVTSSYFISGIRKEGQLFWSLGLSFFTRWTGQNIGAPVIRGEQTLCICSFSAVTRARSVLARSMNKNISVLNFLMKTEAGSGRLSWWLLSDHL